MGRVFRERMGGRGGTHLVRNLGGDWRGWQDGGVKGVEMGEVERESVCEKGGHSVVGRWRCDGTSSAVRRSHSLKPSIYSIIR